MKKVLGYIKNSKEKQEDLQGILNSLKKTEKEKAEEKENVKKELNFVEKRQAKPIILLTYYYINKGKDDRLFIVSTEKGGYHFDNSLDDVDVFVLFSTKNEHIVRCPSFDFDKMYQLLEEINPLDYDTVNEVRKSYDKEKKVEEEIKRIRNNIKLIEMDIRIIRDHRKIEKYFKEHPHFFDNIGVDYD